MPSITLNLNVENAPNPARKHFEKTNNIAFNVSFLINGVILQSLSENGDRMYYLRLMAVLHCILGIRVYP